MPRRSRAPRTGDAQATNPKPLPGRALFAPVYIVTNGGPNGTTQLLMFEAYQTAFGLLNHGRSLAISTIILAIILTIALVELRLFRQPEGST